MKCKIPEISWHNRDPVLSVDVQPKAETNVGVSSSTSSNLYRLASGGTDSHVLIWYLTLAADGSDINLDLAADLTRHQRAVNVVKWSPNGELLASGDDESVVFIWKLKAESDAQNIFDSANEQDKEVWITMKVLRGHMEDIYDLSWSPNSQFLVSGSVDNSAIIWDVHKGKSLAILSDHKGFVQGVTWDPRNQYIATLSTDRYLRIFDIQTKRVVHRINKSVLPVPEGHQLHGRCTHLFHDDTLQTFFRRLSFTPDGKLLITPAGVVDYDGATQQLHTTYVFSRHSLRQPAIVLPCSDQYTVAVRCCPLLFKLRPHNPLKNPPVVPLPYRMIIAVATRSSVYFYDTQQRQPFALISNIHYTRLTDVTWSSDGRIVVVSSTDGFCSIITFEQDELGERYENMQSVLSAIAPEKETIGGSKKQSKKQQKENEEIKKSQKNRKSSMDAVENELVGKVDVTSEAMREPLLEKINEEKSILKTKATTTAQAPAATPIAIKRKPAEICDDDGNGNNEIEGKRKKTDSLTIVSTISENISFNTTDAKPESEKKKANNAIIAKTMTSEIILDKEILSSDEKFESPEKKSCRPATPILVRRTPRSATPSTNPTDTSTNPIPSSTKLKDKSETDNAGAPTPKQMPINSPHHSKRAATPIAVRRKPRALIPTPINVSTSIVAEEALDAWRLTGIKPLKPEQEHEQGDKVENKALEITEKEKEEKNMAAPVGTKTKGDDNKLDHSICELTADQCTEDIRLVYEESVDETSTLAQPSQPIMQTSQLQTQSTQSPTLPSTLTSSSKTANIVNTIVNDAVADVTSNVKPIVEVKTPRQKPQEKQTQQTPNNKTPRRVELKTISTPKSKKKLLE